MFKDKISSFFALNLYKSFKETQIIVDYATMSGSNYNMFKICLFILFYFF